METEYFKTMFPSFPNYTLEMYKGNEPCGTGHKLVDGGIADRWSCKYGGGETFGDTILHASFSINYKITIHIVSNHLLIVDSRYSGKNDIWEYSNDGYLRFPGGVCLSERHRHILEDEKIKQILDTKIDCKFWRIVQKTAKNLYYKT